MDAEIMFYIVNAIALGAWMVIGVIRHNRKNTYMSEEWLARNT